QAGGGSAADAGASGPGPEAAAEVAAQSSPLPVGRQRAEGPRQAAGELLGEQLPGRTEGQGEGACSGGLLASWRATLALLVDRRGLHVLVAGRACRLLLEAGALPADEVRRRLGLAVAPAGDPAQAAAWVEGFLRGSGLVLLHDDALWSVLDEWLAGLR